MRPHQHSALIISAYRELFNKPLPYQPKLFYSGKFKGYNANVAYSQRILEFHLSKKWKDVHDDIKIGLLQHLLVKLFKGHKKTLNIELYNSFLKKVHIAIEKTKTDPLLEQLFIDLNEQFFIGSLEQPNLTWNNSSRTMGVYEYSTDTISISTILKDHDHLIKYVLFHEMLHKKHKYSSGTLRHRHHTKAFKEDEQSYPDADQLEKDLTRVVSRKKKRWFDLL